MLTVLLVLLAAAFLAIMLLRGASSLVDPLECARYDRRPVYPGRK